MGPLLDVPRRLGHAWGFRGIIGGVEVAMGAPKARCFVFSSRVALAMALVVPRVRGDRVASAPAATVPMVGGERPRLVSCQHQRLTMFEAVRGGVSRVFSGGSVQLYPSC